MTGKADTGDAAEAKGTEAQGAAASEKDDAGKAPRPRRIVRSRSTAVAGEGEAPKAEGAAEGQPAGAAPAPEGAAPKDPARPPRHDMRAPARPAGAGHHRPERRGPRPGSIEGMPQRPPRPGALPSRPRPEGMPQRPPRPGALPPEREGRRFDPDRPRPPRGDRPAGGPPRGDRPAHGKPRADHPAAGAEGAPAEARSAAAPKPAPAKPAPKPAAPAPKPAPAAPAPKPAHKAAPPAPLASAPKGNKPAAVFVPLARAGQSAATGKPAAPTAKEALAAKAKAHAHPSKAPAKHDSLPAAAKAALEIPVEALAADWETAKSFVDRIGEGAAALVDGWLGASNAVAIAAIAEANDVSSAARKAARKAIAVLKSRGVAIPERPRSAKVDERGETLEATMIPCDSYGTWSVAITSRDPGGRYRIAEVIAREPAGVIQAAGGWLSGSQLKEGRARAQSNVGMAPVVIPIAWARARVAGALALNAKSGQVIPLGYEACRELFEVPVDATPEHPVADLLAQVTSELVASAAPRSAMLHDEPEFAGWLPDRRALDEMIQKVGERLGPQGTQDPEAVNVAVREETDAATDRYFTPEVRELVASRMQDSAVSVRARRGDERALDVLATARAVKEAGLITSPPREIPFLVAFFHKALGALARMGGGRINVPVRGAAPAPAPAPEPAETNG